MTANPDIGPSKVENSPLSRNDAGCPTPLAVILSEADRGPQRQVFVAGVETGVPSDRSSSLGWGAKSKWICVSIHYGKGGIQVDHSIAQVRSSKLEAEQFQGVVDTPCDSALCSTWNIQKFWPQCAHCSTWNNAPNNPNSGPVPN
jgi:hypothetical protein